MGNLGQAFCADFRGLWRERSAQNASLAGSARIFVGYGAKNAQNAGIGESIHIEDANQYRGGMDQERRRSNVRTLWQILLAIIGVVAIVQELRKPKADRTWHGKVFDLIPYDFRPPTVERVRSTYWNPGGPVLSRKVFGVGWTPNFGALSRLVGKARA